MLNTKTIKKDFPIFETQPDLVYLDSTATSLKPASVIDKISEYYREYSANVHRGIYRISERATAEYEETRKVTAQFIGAKDVREIIFTRNASESLNLLAYSLGREIIDRDDEIVTSITEHHSNFVPWQQLALENRAVLKIIGVDTVGNLDIDIPNLDKIITKKTKILALTYISNVLGTINPLKEIIAAAKKINPAIVTIVDGAQAVPHHKVDVNDLGCDFLVFSSHKMLGPTGTGVLWGKYELLQKMYPFQYGGDMISEVFVDHSIFKDPPYKFEAGTPHIDGVIGLKAAINYLEKLGMSEIENHERELSNYAISKLIETFGETIKIFGGTVKNRCAIVSFRFGTVHPHDVAQILDEENVAIRAGNHCAMPLHQTFGLNATCRASFYLYNDKKDVDALIEALKKVRTLLG